VIHFGTIRPFDHYRLYVQGLDRHAISNLGIANLEHSGIGSTGYQGAREYQVPQDIKFVSCHCFLVVDRSISNMVFRFIRSWPNESSGMNGDLI
jgi:hypothetical protein